MPSSNRVSILFALALAGCGGGGGYDDAPTIALPAGSALAPDSPADQRGVVVANGDVPVTGDRYSPRAIAPMPVPQAVPPDVAQGSGPRGTSGEAHEDGVGYAAALSGPAESRWSNVAIGVAYPGLPTGTLVEVTALDTGRTIVALVVGHETGGAFVALSPDAARALGVGDGAAVRIRNAVANPQDELALRSGQSASPRLDAPPTLLTALRRKLPGQRAAPTRAAASPSVATRTPRPVAPSASARSGFVVQVATLSSAVRAAALARDLGGHVAASGGLYRVQIGPFADTATAARARDGVARRGYGDARILHTE